jgi:hypothetical protein
MTVNTTHLLRLLPLAVIVALSVGACGGPAATAGASANPASANSASASGAAVPPLATPPPAAPPVVGYSQQEFCAKAPTLFHVVRNPSEADTMATAIAATPAAIRPDIQLIVDFQQHRLSELQASQNGGPSKLTLATPAVAQAYRHYNQYCGIR